MSEASEGSQKKTTTFKVQPELLADSVTLTGQGAVWASLSSIETDHETEELVDEATAHRRNVLREELAAMTFRDENNKARRRADMDEERRKAVSNMQKERVNKGITILPDAAKSKLAIRQAMKDEEVTALKEKMIKLNLENEKMHRDIDDKLGISALPRGNDLVLLAEDFYSNKHVPNDQLPEHIRHALTTDEIHDLRRVFELFDAKNKGFITANDLKRAAAMLGFTAKQRIFKEMIDDTPTSKKGKVTFVGFLDLVVKLQGDGPDPYDEMKQFFNLLDKDGKGYVTFKDLRSASDELKIPLSNNAIRDMMSEADPLGDGKIRLDNLVPLLGQSASFRSMAPSI